MQIMRVVDPSGTVFDFLNSSYGYPRRSTLQVAIQPENGRFAVDAFQFSVKSKTNAIALMEEINTMSYRAQAHYQSKLRDVPLWIEYKLNEESATRYAKIVNIALAEFPKELWDAGSAQFLTIQLQREYPFKGISPIATPVTLTPNNIDNANAIMSQHFYSLTPRAGDTLSDLIIEVEQVSTTKSFAGFIMGSHMSQSGGLSPIRAYSGGSQALLFQYEPASREPSKYQLYGAFSDTNQDGTADMNFRFKYTITIGKVGDLKNYVTNTDQLFVNTQPNAFSYIGTIDTLPLQKPRGLDLSFGYYRVSASADQIVADSSALTMHKGIVIAADIQPFKVMAKQPSLVGGIEKFLIDSESEAAYALYSANDEVQTLNTYVTGRYPKFHPKKDCYFSFLFLSNDVNTGAEVYGPNDKSSPLAWGVAPDLTSIATITMKYIPAYKYLT